MNRSTLKLSHNEGQTWEDVSTVHLGPTAYSDMVQINRQNPGCLYEAGELSPYEGIWFRIVNIR
jgi:sialidase-1